jgi:hypothetical protein
MSKQTKVTLSKEELLKKDCLSTVAGTISYNSYRLSMTEKAKVDYGSFENMVKWQANDIIKCETMAECLEVIKTEIEESNDVNACLKKLFAGIFSTTKSCISNSTSVFSNAINSAKQSGYFEILEMLLRMQSYES